MTRRGRELADEMAIRVMELSGVSKAHTSGQGLSDFFRPAAEVIVKAEKTLSSVARTQKRLIDQAEEQSRWQYELTEFSEQLLQRVEAMAQPRTYDQFLPGEWRMSRVNGHNRNIPTSTGIIPEESM